MKKPASSNNRKSKFIRLVSLSAIVLVAAIFINALPNIRVQAENNISFFGLAELFNWQTENVSTPAPLDVKKLPAESVETNGVLEPDAPVTTNGGSGLAGTYPDLATAITALNAATITSPVVITANGTETAPAGGYVITASGTAANTIVIDGGATTTITAPNPQTAGSLTDAIFKLNGADFVTINGFTMLENPANTTTAAATNNMTEFGVALFYATTTDGAQNNTISANTIDLNRTYQNTFGVYSNTRHTSTSITTAEITAASGANSGTIVRSNTITDVNVGVVNVGALAAGLQNDGLTVGGATAAQANQINNFGTTTTISSYPSVSGSVNGVLVNNTVNATVSNNTIASSVGGVTGTGTVRGIYVQYTGTAPTTGGPFTTNINNNNISLRPGNAANTVVGIANELGTAVVNVNINGNDFNNTSQTVAATGAVTFILSNVAALNQNYNNNTFTNLTVTTTGATIFISASATLPANGTQNVNGNSIVTAFNRTGASGATTLFTNSSSSPGTVVQQNNNNNFSNITVTGTSTIAGFSNIDGGSPTKTVTGNTFNNWTSGTGSIVGLVISFQGQATVSGNTISNFTGGGTITGLSTSSGGSVATDLFTQNTVFGLTGSGTGTVTGILNSGGTARNITRNKVYNISNTNAGGGASGITVSSGTTINLQNNLVGNITTPNVNATNSLFGINISGGTTVTADFNTVYLNANSTGANFGSSALNASSTPNVTLRNNILVNLSTASGTGLTAAYRRGSTTLTSYNNASNNNDFYAGTPSATNVIFFDGTNSDQTLAQYKVRVSPRDSASVSENPNFLSTNGADATFLHINPATPSQLESGGIPVTGITVDYDGETRNATAPDIGADEFSGTALDLSPPTITYTPLQNTTATTNRTISVTITDPSGVAGGANSPRIYFRKNGGMYTSTQCVLVMGNNYDCTIDYSLVGGVTTNDVIDYFVVAQDTNGNVGSNPNAGFSATSVNNVTSPPTNPNTYTIVAGTTGTLEVGAGNTCGAGGTDPCPFQSLTNAGGLFAALNAAVITGNITINLRSDLTAETGAVALNQLNEEGTAPGTYTVTIKPSGAARVISGTAAAGLIRLNGADRVTIDGSTGGGTDRSLTITNTSTATGTAAIQISSAGVGAGATNNTVKNTNLSCGSDQSINTNVTYGIAHGGATLGSSGADNDNNSFINNAITKVNIGIFSSGENAANQVQNTVISNNLIGPAAFGADQIGRAGIIFNLTNNAQVTGNEVRFVGVTEPQTSGGGSYDKFGISHAFNGWSETVFGDLVVSNTLIARNKIHDIVEENTFSAVGIFMAGGNGANDTLNTTVNNFIYNVRANGTLGDNSASLGIASGKGDTVAFNSIYMAGDLDPGLAGSSGTSSFGVQITSATVVNLTLRDNISFVDLTSNTATLKHGSIKIPASFVWGTGGSNYNDLYVPAANTQAIVGRVGTTDAPTLTDWQTASGQDANSKSVDPLFISATDLHLQSASPVRAMGNPVAGITTDIDGDTRHPVTPDIGADEFASFVNPTVQFNSATYMGAEGTTATITVTRTGDTTVASSVAYATSDGTATGGTMCGASVDYENASGTLNFAVGETSKTFNVVLCSDVEVKGSETINLTLSMPSNATLGTPSTAVLTITNVAPPMPGVLALSSSTYTVGEAGGTVTITVNRTGGTDGAVGATYALTNGTATGGAECGGTTDYVNTGSTVSFANGEASKTFTVQICNDTLFEGDETFNVTLSAPTGGATLGMPTTAVVTITDDEVAQPGTLALSSATYTVGEAGGTVTITVNRTGGTDGAVTVPYTLTNGAMNPATGGAECVGMVDYVNTGGTVSFAAGEMTKTFTVQICNDSVFEGDETFNVVLGTATGGATTGTPSTAVVTITDDETAPTGNVIVNPGNVSYMTLKEAFDAINAGTHTGAVTIGINANTTETASAILNASGSGTASYTSVVITPLGGARIVEGNFVGAVIKLNGADNVTIDGRISGTGRNLTVRNNSTVTATAAIWLSSVAAGDGASNNVIRNLEVAAGATSNVNALATFGIIMNGATIGVAVGGNDNDNNQFIANRITKARYGIVSRGVAANNNEGLVITDNIIGPEAFGADQIGKAGIFLQLDTGATVSRNTVQFVGGDFANTTVGADRCGICIGGENWGQAEAGALEGGDYAVTKNIVHDVVEERTFSSVGIRLGTTRAGMPTNNLVANNFIYNIRANGTVGDQVAAIGYSGGNTDRIVFNSISLTGDMDPGTAAASTIYGNAMRVSTVNGVNNANLTMMNNSIYVDVNSNTATNRFFAITLPAANYSFGTGGLNYNNYYINQANPQLRTGGIGVTSGNSPGTVFQTLADWQLALTPPQDQNSIQADPLYVSNTSDLHIQPTSLNESRGIAIAGVTDDIDGNMRPATPDIGADEISVMGPGVIQFSSTNFSGLEGTTATITVIRSAGTDGTVGITATVTDGTAMGGAACGGTVDYINPGPQMLTFGPGESTKTFTIQLCTDALLRSNETVILTLSNQTGGATIGANNPATLTIIDVPPPFGGTINVGAGETFTSLTNPGGVFEAINGAGLSGNLTVNITSDLTAETGTISLNQFTETGPGGYTLTIKPSGAARTVSGTTGGAARGLIGFNATDRVTIDGSLNGGTDRSLTINNLVTNNSGGVIYFASLMTNGATDNTIKNVNVWGQGATTGSLLGITFASSTFGALGSNHDNNRMENNDVRGAFYGIAVLGESAANQNTGTVITKNVMPATGTGGFGRAGIYVGNDDGGQFTENNIASVTTNLVADCIGLAIGNQNIALTPAAQVDVTNALIARNYIGVVSNTGTQASVGIVIGSGTTGTNTVVNNMVTGVIGSSTLTNFVAGIYAQPRAGSITNIYHNSVSMSGERGANANLTPSFALAISADQPINVVNNILVNTQTRTGGTGGGGESYAIGFAGPAMNANLLSNFNDLFVSGPLGQVGITGGLTTTAQTTTAGTGTNHTTLAAWQTATTEDANSLSVNPLFVSATDLHLQAGSPMINAGTNVMVTTDFDGQTRDAMPDIGADEFSAAAMPGTLALSSSTYSVNEGGGTVTITVNRTGGTSGAVSVNYTLANGTATGGAMCGGMVDFVNTGGTVNFADGEMTKTFTVQICEDMVFEGDETFTVTLSGAMGGATVGTPATATVTIIDNDPQPIVPRFSINDVRVREGDSGTRTGTFTVTLANPGMAVATVQYATANGTATAGVDYVATSGTLTFNPGTTTQTITVTVIGDLVIEPNETFFVNLSNPTGGTMISDSQGVGIIIDEDRAYTSDYDGDEKTDYTVFRPSNGFWYSLLSTSETVNSTQFGIAEDIPVPSDYDADGITDLAVFRPSVSTWYILRSSDFAFVARQWGASGDLPVQGDYDGDGRADIAVFRPSNGVWYVIPSSTPNQPTGTQFGANGDQPVQGDYDGDGKTDFAVFRAGTWFVLRSATNSSFAIQFGASSDKPVVGDFDGDGSNDFAVYRNGVWFIYQTLTQTSRAVNFGEPSDIPSPGDYDGDGTTDISVWRPAASAIFFVLNSSDGSFMARQWGQTGDKPIPSRYQPPTQP